MRNIILLALLVLTFGCSSSGIPANDSGDGTGGATTETEDGTGGGTEEGDGSEQGTGTGSEDGTETGEGTDTVTTRSPWEGKFPINILSLHTARDQTVQENFNNYFGFEVLRFVDDINDADIITEWSEDTLAEMEDPNIYNPDESGSHEQDYQLDDHTYYCNIELLSLDEFVYVYEVTLAHQIGHCLGADDQEDGLMENVSFYERLNEWIFINSFDEWFVETFIGQNPELEGFFDECAEEDPDLNYSNFCEGIYEE